MVINKYKVVQTGAKTQSGGVKDDLFKLEYQGSLEESVANLPINDRIKVIIAKINKEKNLFFNITILYINLL